MKKIILFNALILILGLFSFSCKEEEFNPNGELKDKYILACILRSDTTMQEAYVSRSFQVEGFDPKSNTQDPAVLGVDLRVWHKDTVYTFRDSILNQNNSGTYAAPGVIYLNRQFKPEPGAQVEIEALLSNGKRLKASTKMPSLVNIDEAETDTLVPTPGKSAIAFGWTASDMNLYYVPRLSIIYFKKINGIDTRFLKPIPLSYVAKGGIEVPYFPGVSSQHKIVYDMAAIDRAMREISEGDEAKANYTILSIQVDILALDGNAGAYYSSGKTQSDGFTLKIDQADFTNISGGLGVFGAYTKSTFAMRFDNKYITSFRYTPGLKSK